MTTRTATATRGVKLKATRVPIEAAPASLDVMLGPADGTGFQRLDLAIRRSTDGNLHLDVGIPSQLGPAVASLLSALGVKHQ